MKILLTFLTMLMTVSAHAKTPERVITIGGALTETVFALGAEQYLVGSDTTSYYPQAAEEMPKVGYQRALSAEGILSLNPDLVILTKEAGPQTVIEQIKAANIEILTLEAARNVDDIINTIAAIGKALDKSEQADTLIAAMQQKQRQLSFKGHTRPKVLIVHQHAGGAPTAAGINTAANSIIALSGGQNVVTKFANYKPLTPEAAIALAPELIIVAAPNASSIEDKSSLTNHPLFAHTPAGKNNRVYVMDALEILGFGPRTVESAKKLHALYGTL